MKTYVYNIKYKNYSNGYYYKTNSSFHIDINKFPEYKLIGNVEKCNISIIDKKYYLESKFNEIYCKTSYFLIKE